MRRRVFAQLWLTFTLIVSATLQAAEPLNSELTLGVFAYRPKPIIEARYQPLVDYLNTQLKATHIKMRVLELKEIEEALADNQLDFIFTNPRHYILLRSRNKLTGAIATLIKQGNGGVATQSLGGVIFTRSGRNEIEQLSDIKGRRIAVPGSKYLGGFQCQSYELLQAGIQLPGDASLIEVGRHDAVVDAVLAGQADVGFVRTEVLEDLSHNGKLDLAQIKVLNRQNLPGFPFVVSTRLYPEWPFIALPHVDQHTVSRIASALLALEADHPVARTAGIAGFAPPADYLPVEKVTRALRLPPYDHAPDFTWRDIIEKYQIATLILMLSLVIISFLMWILARRNRQLSQSGAALTEAVSSQNAILTAIPDLMFELDAEGRYLDVWAKNPEQLVADKAMLLGRSVSEMLPAEAAEQVMSALHEADEKGHSHGHQIQLTTQDGGSMWFELSTSLKNRETTPHRFIMLSRNITERKHANDQLRKLSRAVEQSHSTVVITDLDANIEFVNPAFTRSTGYTLEEVLGQNPRILQSGHQDAAFYQAMWETLTTGEEWQGELHNKRKDASLYWEFAAISPVKDETGKTTHYVAVKENITTRREAEQALKESEERLELAMSVANDGIWDWDLVNNTVVFDSRYYTMAGYEPNEFPSALEEWQKRVHPDDIRMALFAVEQHYAGESKSFDIEFRFLRKDGDYMWIRGRAKVISRDEKGYPLRFVGTHSDITKRKQMEVSLQLSEKKYRQLVENLSKEYFFYLHDLDGVFTFVSPSVTKMLGYSQEEFSTHFETYLTDHPVNKEASNNTAQSIRGIQQPPYILEIYDKSGERKWLEVIESPHFDNEGKVIAVEGIAKDITEQKAAQEQLRLAASVFAHSHEGIIITDANNRIADVNPACIQLTGYSREEVLGKNPNLFSSGTQTPEFYADMWQTLAKSGHWQGDIWNRRKSGEVYSERLSIDAVHDEAGKMQHYVAVFYDTTYLKEHEAELERIAYSDALTELPNRLLLRDRMQQALTQAKRHEKLVAICYLDLDGFKPINDTHGHKAGDQVLIEVAQRLQGTVRTGDTVARLGGDEFVLLMLDLSSIGELEQVVERILQSVAQPYKLPEATVTLSASIGIALYPLDEGEADTLLRHADQAMYVAKQRGKNRYSFFDPSEEQRATDAHAIQHEIEAAIAEEQFLLFYQPKVNMRSGAVVGVEALIRWQHPQRGLLAPGVFLPAIEETPLIIEVGNWVLRQALSQMRAWQAVGIELKVSVNIAAQQLQQLQFVSSLKNLLAEFDDVPAEHLELEILESTALHDIGYISRIMEECKTLGVQFALDDFGTGYSSLTYLKRLPASVLKIDQSFVRDLLDDPEDLAITEGILGLARAFRRTLVAEGVETVQHGTLLLNLGCELGQGHGIAPPMPAEEIPAWLDSFQIPPEWSDARDTIHSNADFSMLIMSVEHHRVVSRVLNAIEQRAPSLLPEHLHDHHSCEFGQWLDGEANERFGKLPEFSHIVAKHRNVHKLIKQATVLLAKDDTEALQTIAAELKEIRNDILDCLNRLRHEDHQLK